MSAVAKIELRPFAMKTALIVDDDPQIEALLLRVLKPESWAVQHAVDNAAVFLLAQRKAFDLILTNQKTTGREDIELLRKIRRVRPHTRLIILTDQSTPSDARRSF